MILNIWKRAALAGACVAALAMTGCGQKNTADETRGDVDRAQATGAKDVAKEQSDADLKTINAQQLVNEANTHLDSVAAKAQLDVAIAEAEAAHKVALARCNGLTSDGRSACRDQADKELEAAKARVTADASVASAPSRSP